jgi:hypothetical protein
MYFAGPATAKQGKRKDVNLAQLGDVVVMNEWYRRALGGFETTQRGGGHQKLDFDEPWALWWGDLRAACQHPEPGVRVSTKIAILSTWLGVTALLLAIVETETLKAWFVEHCMPYATLSALGLCFLFGIFCIFAGRSVKS